jgi:hypothetical protein
VYFDHHGDGDRLERPTGLGDDGVEVDRIRSSEASMPRISFEPQPHPRIAERRKVAPPTTTAEHVGVNGRIALVLTTVVGTMWCAYAFAALALVVLPQAVGGGLLTLVQWLSQTFIQLVMLSVIMVGQNILGRVSDKRAAMTYRDASATFHETGQIQAHLQAQDEAINALLDKLDRLEKGMARS